MIRRPGPSRAHQDRWLLSYADFITLLFAFFVTMYAISSVDNEKLGTASSSMEVAFNGDPVAASVTGPPRLVTPPVVVPPAPSLDQIRMRLMESLGEAIKTGRLEITEDARGLVLSLPEGATFESASADMTPTAQELIEHVAAELAQLPHALRIEGHTDDVPIRSGRYRSNWELSTARASSVVALLIERTGIEAGRLSAAGYAEFHPRVANDTPEHRAKNRRVDLVVLRHEDPEAASTTKVTKNTEASTTKVTKNTKEENSDAL